MLIFTKGECKLPLTWVIGVGSGVRIGITLLMYTPWKEGRSWVSSHPWMKARCPMTYLYVSSPKCHVSGRQIYIHSMYVHTNTNIAMRSHTNKMYFSNNKGFPRLKKWLLFVLCGQECKGIWRFKACFFIEPTYP